MTLQAAAAMKLQRSFLTLLVRRTRQPVNYGGGRRLQVPLD